MDSIDNHGGVFVDDGDGDDKSNDDHDDEDHVVITREIIRKYLQKMNYSVIKLGKGEQKETKKEVKFA